MKIDNNESESKIVTTWSVAKKRAAFKYYLFIYIMANILLWGIWFLNSSGNVNASSADRIPWPVWPMFFWGIGIMYNYFEIFKSKYLEQKSNKI